MTRWRGCCSEKRALVRVMKAGKCSVEAVGER